MKLIVGLGNPGEEYAKTRHNIGFQVTDLVHNDLKFDEFQLKNKFDAYLSEGDFKNEKVFLAKPATFMNLSGTAVQKISSFYKIESKDIWIIVDDLDLKLGDIKIKEKGSAGSHNGLISIIQCLGTENFPRFKIGIESRESRQIKGKDFVLNQFSKEEEKIIKKARESAKDAIILGLKEGIMAAMNKYNKKT